MTQFKKSPFIEGFKEPTLTKNNFITLADIRGDGQGKLVIWSDQQSQLIVYKASNRQLQKPSKIKNVSGIISYFDEQRNPKAVIGITAQNGLYIFRSMNQSFRLRIPDIFARQQQQILWSQYENDPQSLTQQLSKTPRKYLSETARHYVSATTQERKRQLIQKVFSDGINEKDSISAVCNLRQNPNAIGNIIIGTELNRLYILDCYGHTIIQQRVIDSAPMIMLSHGSYQSNFVIVSIDREGEITFHLKGDPQKLPQAEKLKLSSRVITADLTYPELIVCTEDQVVSVYSLSNSYTKLFTKKYSFKLPKQPIKVLFIEYKSTKLSLAVFQDEFRLYLERQVIYSHFTTHKMYDVFFGSFAKQQNCLILMYENNGFQVLILHRQFNPKQLYGSNKQTVQETEDIKIPKKSTEFKAYWQESKDSTQAYKIYERSIKMLKWMTYKEKFSEKVESETNIKINSKVLGLGPDFIVKLSVQNTSDQSLQNVSITPVYNKNSLKLTRMLKELPMISPNIPYNLDIRVESKSLKNQTIDFQFFFANSCFKTTVHLPNCEEFANQ